MIAMETEPVAAGAHSCVLQPRLKSALADAGVGKYGRMFPHLPPPAASEQALLALGRSGAVMDDAKPDDDGGAGNNPCIPAGFTFLGQLIAHDITADRSLL